MDDRQTYATEDEAQAVADGMKGWPDPHPVEIVTDGRETGTWSSLVNDWTTWVVCVDLTDDDLPLPTRWTGETDEDNPTDAWPEPEPGTYTDQPRYLRTDGFVR